MQFVLLSGSQFYIGYLDTTSYNLGRFDKGHINFGIAINNLTKDKQKSLGFDQTAWKNQSLGAA